MDLNVFNAATTVYTHTLLVPIRCPIGNFGFVEYSTSRTPQTQVPQCILGYECRWYRSAHPTARMFFPTYPGAFPLVLNDLLFMTRVEDCNCVIRTMRQVIDTKNFSYASGVSPGFLYTDLPHLLQVAYEYDPLRAAIDAIEGRDFFTEYQWRKWKAWP